MKSEEKLDQCYEAVKDQLPFVPKLALILGSGLGDYAEHVTVEKTIPYESIEGFPRSTVAGHKGQFVFAKVEGVPTVMMQGRVHYYEGYPMQDVVLPVRLMKKMGAEILFLTNAAGGVNENFHAGDLIFIFNDLVRWNPVSLTAKQFYFFIKCLMAGFIFSSTATPAGIISSYFQLSSS